ncbi:MAG: BlaI/MecI/CopY family transcriptional regulator [Alphaproteobacteria bacterium]|nr:MAG: BlaI/MecI/CopY family transcriptional regulator [Alphaproteobacteria bacterium]
MIKQKSVHLSVTQLDLMRVLWREGEADTKTVCNALKKTLAYTTVATLLKRLEKRGVIKSTQRDRKLFYKPLISEEEVLTSMVSSLIGTLFKGDSSALVSHLVREEEINKDDLEKITDLIKKGKQS